MDSESGQKDLGAQHSRVECRGCDNLETKKLKCEFHTRQTGGGFENSKKIEEE
jgi:hypothetical protein